MINTIIIDDELLSREIIKELLSKLPEINLIEEFSSPLKAFNYIKENEINLIFLDYHMPDFTGFEFLETLENAQKYNVIIVTSDRDKALESYEYSCIKDYLVKPISLPRLVKAIEKVSKLINDAETKYLYNNQNQSNVNLDEFFIKVDKKLIRIAFSEIDYIEASGDYVLIYTEKNERHLINSSLKNIQQKLNSNILLRVHRSYIVNMKKISDIQDNSLVIKNKVIPISKSNKKELFDKLNLI